MSDNAGCCAPPEPPSSSAKRLRNTVNVPGSLPAEGRVCEGGSTLEKAAVPQDLPGKETHGGGRDTERPAGCFGACGGGDGRRNGGGGARAGEDSGGGPLSSSRPLRVFVSQGDVVYVDEVEAVAIRGGHAAAATAEHSADGHTCGEKIEETNGKSSTGKPDGETAQQQSDTSAKSTNDGESASPAFFDPLLNPGGSGGQNHEGGAWSSAVLLLVPLRLGLDELSAGYIPSESHFKACSCWCCCRCFMDANNAGQ